MKTKANVIMLFSLCVSLVSGCSEKYIAVKCQTPKPPKTELENCGGIKGDMAFADCARKKFIAVEGDYEALSVAFESCK